MQLYFYMCSGFQERLFISRLIEILLKNDLVLFQESGETADGKLGPIPYRGEISRFLEGSYTNDVFSKPSDLVYSGGLHFQINAITKLKYSEPDTPRFDYITITLGGMMLGENYNYITALIDFHTAPAAPDIESPYFEDGAQLMVELGLDLYNYLKPWYGWLDYPPHSFLSREAIRDRKELDTLYWGNFYGPQYINQYGPNLFLESPCWKKEKLPNDGIYLQSSQLFTKPVSGETRIKLKKYFSPYGITLSANPFD